MTWLVYPLSSQENTLSGLGTFTAGCSCKPVVVSKVATKNLAEHSFMKTMPDAIAGAHAQPCTCV